MTTYTPTPRPPAADLDAATRLANALGNRTDQFLGPTPWETSEAVRILRNLAADLAVTRAERDAARAALPDAQMLDSYAAGIEWEGFEASGLRKTAAAIRALDAAPAAAADDVAGATS